MINNKAVEQAVRDVYETKTGQSGMPGTGPADYIRGFAGINVPKKSGTRRKIGGVSPQVGDHINGVLVPEVGDTVNGIKIDRTNRYKAWALAHAAQGERSYLGKIVPPRGNPAGNYVQGTKLLWLEKNGQVIPELVILSSIRITDEYQPDTKRPKTARGRMSRRKTLRNRK